MTDTANTLKLSVLDLIPLREGQTSAQAIEAARNLARVADEAGFTRYWLAEHHNMPAIASTTPPVLIGVLAAATQRIRVGSGGVMLPNHAPLAVAEQFAALEASYPGRIDLGIGRAPGSDPVTNWALRSGGIHQGPDADPVARFPEYVEQIMTFMSPEGAQVQIGGRRFDITATPRAAGQPPIWLLGSSDYSARLAARLGVPYVFAHHFAGRGTAEALELYRSQFVGHDGPRTFLTVNAVIGDTTEEAWALARPYRLMNADIFSGSPMRPMYTVEQAAKERPNLPEERFEALTEPWLVGTVEEVADGIRALAKKFDVDEVMIQPIAGVREDEPMDHAHGREHTIRALGRRMFESVG